MDQAMSCLSSLDHTSNFMTRYAAASAGIYWSTLY